MDAYGDEVGDFMENIIAKLIDVSKNTLCCGVTRLKLNDMCSEIANVKYNELLYDSLTETPWVHVHSGEGLTIWILPK